MAPSHVTVTVRRTLTSTPEQLFATLTDPALFARVRGISSVTVQREGADGPAGAGTRRRVGLPAGAHLVEEIVAIDPPTRFDYRIVDASAPMEHSFGRIAFVRRSEVTEATWTTSYAVPVPLVGGLLTHASRPVIAAAFHTALGAMDAAAKKVTA